MFPTQKLRDFASWTSLTLVDAGQMAITPQELLKVIGLLYGMTVQQHGERRSYWRVEGEGEESLFPAPAWGTRFGMGQRRFETVLCYLTPHVLMKVTGGTLFTLWLMPSMSGDWTRSTPPVV